MSAVGKVEGKVPTSTLPSRSTVKLPEGSRSKVCDELPRFFKKPIELKLSSSYPELVAMSWNAASRCRIPYRFAGRLPHAVGGRGRRFLRSGRLATVRL